MRLANHKDTSTRIVELVRQVRRDQPRVGTKKAYSHIKPTLQRETLKCGRDKLFDILRANDMLVVRKKRYEKTTYSEHDYAVAPNRIKDIEVTEPNKVYVSDITYIRIKSSFAYLFLVTDAFSRKIVGFHLSRDLTHHSALLALNMATSHLSDPRGIIHHSDRGCQYCCHEFLDFLQQLNMASSMTDSSHCYQNAIAERVNGILKDEFSLDAVFTDFDSAKRAVVRAVLVYNTKRLHWSLGLKTPNQIHQLAA